MRPLLILVLLVLCALACPGFSPAAAQTQIQPPITAPPAGPLQILPPTLSPDLRIVWEVKNRFRLFRKEADFLRQVAAQSIKSVLAAEQIMSSETDGRGWARNILGNLCIDPMGAVMTTCERDGARESYLAPADHRIEMRLVGASPQNACAWVFDEGDGAPRNYSGSCGEEVRIRLAYGKPTIVTVDVTVPNAPPQRATAEIAVRDLLIAGLGDSIAAGEGNPDRPVALSDEGFCFRRFGTGSEYFRPGRATFKGDRTCESGNNNPSQNLAEWTRLGARWMSQACHRSLYSYQLRTALALAVENPHIAVTYLPLACTGATIDAGLLGTQRARELNCTPDKSCPSTVPAQVTQLQQYLATARRTRPGRNLDLILLTVGANDIDFSGLVANVIIDSTGERVLFGRSVIASVEYADNALTKNLPGSFAKLRAALKPMVGGDLSRVVFVSYGHPALQADGTPCSGGQAGFDVHPSFRLDGERLRRVADFVGARFLPALKAIVQCSGAGCANPADRMTFVDAHQQAFQGHGVCAHSEQDPEFDRACFLADGKSFATSPVEGAVEPMTCRYPASEFRAYSPRARWIRTANDSYFVAMTFPEGLPSTLQPTDIHDATWGVVSAVYGGAVHPTAEGQAAMADAALAAARRVLGVQADAPVNAETLAPLPPPREIIQ